MLYDHDHNHGHSHDYGHDRLRVAHYTMMANTSVAADATHIPPILSQCHGCIAVMLFHAS